MILDGARLSREPYSDFSACTCQYVNRRHGNQDTEEISSSSTRSTPESLNGVNPYSVCGLVATGNTRSCELPGHVVRPIMVP